MNELRKLADVLHKFNFILLKRHKQYAVMMLFLSMIAAVLELLGVAVIIPILEMMLDMKTARDKWYVKAVTDIIPLHSDIQIIWVICTMTILVYLVKNLFFSFYNWVSLKYSAKVQRELAIKIMRAYMKQGYIFFVQNNTARLLQGMTSDIGGVYQILSTLLTLTMKFLTIFCIAVFIIFQSKEMAFVLMILAAGCFLLIQICFRKPMEKYGRSSRHWAYECSKTSLEAIQGNKEILAMHKQDFFVEQYEKALAKMNSAMVKVDLGAALPTYIIEMTCISGVLLSLAVQIALGQDMYGLITKISAMALGAFRILPALGGITSGINSIRSHTPQLAAAYQTLEDVKELEKIEVKKETESDQYRGIEFQKEIEFRDVSFKYPEGEDNVLENINMKIRKGESIAFIGPSGAGKTTSADIILALLKPTAGKVLMDGIDIEDLGGEWSRIIGYVPQSLFIVDDTIRRNIALGEDPADIDDELIWKALETAQLGDFVRSLPAGIETMVGEWGIRFSGGQRQRLAIARALYRNPEILVLDEATAALDNTTETEVMKAIEALQGYKTLIIVAHRLTTVKKCDIIYEVRDKKVIVRDKAEVLSVE